MMVHPRLQLSKSALEIRRHRSACNYAAFRKAVLSHAWCISGYNRSCFLWWVFRVLWFQNLPVSVVVCLFLLRKYFLCLHILCMSCPWPKEEIENVTWYLSDNQRRKKECWNPDRQKPGFHFLCWCLQQDPHGWSIWRHLLQRVMWMLLGKQTFKWMISVQHKNVVMDEEQCVCVCVCVCVCAYHPTQSACLTLRCHKMTPAGMFYCEVASVVLGEAKPFILFSFCISFVKREDTNVFILYQFC